MKTRNPESNPPVAKKVGRPRISVEDRLLGAVERLLSQGQAFSNLTVEALASEANISRATFYLRFSEKNALIAALLQRISDDIVVSSGRWFNGDGDADPATVQEGLRGIVQAFKRHQPVLAAVAEIAPFDATVQQLHQQMLVQLRLQSRAAIARIRRQGRAHPLATDALADLLTDMIELYCSRHLRDLNAKALDELAVLLAHIGASAMFAQSVLQEATPLRMPARRQGARSNS